ncbi:MAG: TetR/AcrR family transcriptional regulator [Sphingomonas sp.]|nr:TetR/AcrR family transcriptional regulator [Sphingomonas sp.]
MDGCSGDYAARFARVERAVVKSDERRDALLDKLADFVLAEGLSAASLRPMAQAAGISDRMLLYYFKDKTAVMAATLERIAQRMMVLMDSGTARGKLDRAALQAHLLDLVLADAFWPYMRIWLEVASMAARNDSLYRPVAEQIGRAFLSWGIAQLDGPTPEAREADAARILVTIEGMVMVKSFGLDAICLKAL